MYRIDNILNLYNLKSNCRYFMIKAFSPCPVVVGIMFRSSGRKNRFRNFELDTFRTSFNIWREEAVYADLWNMFGKKCVAVRACPRGAIKYSESECCAAAIWRDISGHHPTADAAHVLATRINWPVSDVWLDRRNTEYSQIHAQKPLLWIPIDKSVNFRMRILLSEGDSRARGT